ncbi:MAG: hypothetical protein ABIY70_22880 [Capsulimonas sp.]|uniref:hypothetical protein n=1 Tax=Capsulimonas sp. TaxID=2494211 RepID=UPI0032636394
MEKVGAEEGDLGELLAAMAHRAAVRNDTIGFRRQARRRWSFDTYYFYYTPKSPADDTPLGAKEAKRMLDKLSAP